MATVDGLDKKRQAGFWIVSIASAISDRAGRVALAELAPASVFTDNSLLTVASKEYNQKEKVLDPNTRSSASTFRQQHWQSKLRQCPPAALVITTLQGARSQAKACTPTSQVSES